MARDIRGGATGSMFTGHDARYHYARDLHGGTEVSNAGNPAQLSRRTLAATGTTSVSGLFSIDAHWRAVALRWSYFAAAAGSGSQGVKFQVRYGLTYPILGNDALNVTLTTVAIPTITNNPWAIGAQGYALPTETSALLTPPDGFIGSSPQLSYSIDRLADDAADTLAQAIAIVSATITRVD